MVGFEFVKRKSFQFIADQCIHNHILFVNKVFILYINFILCIGQGGN